MSNAEREPTLQEQIEACEVAAGSRHIEYETSLGLEAAAKTLRELQQGYLPDEATRDKVIEVNVAATLPGKL